MMRNAPEGRRLVPRHKDAPPADTETAASPRLFIRVIFGDGAYLGPGKVDLLENIERLGSIASAGKAMGMSYKRAWYLIDEINGMFARPLVVKQHGGATGGGAVVTPLGRQVIAQYRALQRAAANASSEHLHELQKAIR